jgi:iron only hydrogenase large subunit-like protein
LKIEKQSHRKERKERGCARENREKQEKFHLFVAACPPWLTPANITQDSLTATVVMGTMMG